MNASDWAGTVGDTWADLWPATDRTFAPVDAALVETAAALVPDVVAARILDIGCGAGTTTLSLAARLTAPRITGIDLSPSMIAVATGRATAAGLTEHATTPVEGTEATGWCAFLEADATRWAGSESFDLIVSRHGVMFFDDPVAALAHIRSLAAPGAPLAFSCFRDIALNAWAAGLTGLLPPSGADPHAPGPFAFADRDHVAGLLALAGWREARAVAFDYDYTVAEGPDALKDAADFFARIGPAAHALRLAPEADRAALLASIETLARYHLTDGRVAFPAAAWLWTARA